MMRSLLFVPGDSERKIIKNMNSAADALIFDLEESVAMPHKAQARALVAKFLKTTERTSPPQRFIVRINALNSGLSDEDLKAVIPAAPDIILLPKANSGADIQDLSARIAVHEANADLPEGRILIHALMTQTPAALLAASSFSAKSNRLHGLAWENMDLAAEIGASSNTDDQGHYTDVFRMARTMTLLASANARVNAIDSVFTDITDVNGLEQECKAAVRDGFIGKLAIHPAQIPTINKTFTPSPCDVEHAVEILALFAAQGSEVNMISLDGKMIGKRQRLQAEHIVRRAGLAVDTIQKKDN